MLVRLPFLFLVRAASPNMKRMPLFISNGL